MCIHSSYSPATKKTTTFQASISVKRNPDNRDQVAIIMSAEEAKRLSTYLVEAKIWDDSKEDRVAKATYEQLDAARLTH